MIKIKDRILLGVLSGIICGIPGMIVNDLEYHLGLTDVKYGQMAANLFLPKNQVNTKDARIVASLTNHTGIGLMGVMVCYLLSATGRDYASLKGMGVGAAAWTAVYGLTARVGLSVKTRKPLAPILSFVDHALFGALCGLFISKFGHDSLFPDANITNSKDKLPLLSIKDDSHSSKNSNCLPTTFKKKISAEVLHLLPKPSLPVLILTLSAICRQLNSKCSNSSARAAPMRRLLSNLSVSTIN